MDVALKKREKGSKIRVDNKNMNMKLFLVGLGVVVFLVVYNFINLNRNTAIQNFSTGNTFKGYKCTQDCSGHKAGYAWAEKKGITSPSDCGGKSQSFIEGCRAYAENN